MVFYRKYRPQTLEELIGQDHVKQAFNSAIAAGKLAHAYLFCGPKGTGKTSTARILAKIVNCEKLQETNPCNKCSACLSITDGSNLDVVEMDAASNRGIEDIRNLRDNIKLAPTSAKKKVYIIDEVHMLSNDAFNALLKTLEEPPPHVLFILATTEVQKIPQTILSRVHKMDFKLASIGQLIEDLGKIANAEGLEIDQETLLILAKKANGSFRDAEKFLDQLSALGSINPQVIEEHFNTGNLENVCKILGFIAKKDVREALVSLNAQTESGVNLKELVLSMLDILRQILFIKNDLGDVVVKQEMGEETYQLVKSLATDFTLGSIIHVIDCLQKSLEQSRYVSIPSLPLEVAVVESCEGGKLSAISRQSSDNTKEKKQTVDNGNLKVDVEDRSLKIEDAHSDDLAKIQEKWAYISETVRQYNYSLEALLRTVKMAESSEKVVVIEVPYSFHQRILEAPKSRDLLESVLSDVLGRSVKISVKLGQRPVREEEIANVEVAADDEIVRIAAEIFNSETVN